MLAENPVRVQFTIPMLPPSVNHYTEHPAAGVHIKSAAAKAFERDFPLFARDLFVQSDSGRFRVSLVFRMGPRDRGDVDNFNKVVLDCIAKRGMLRDRKGEPVSDAWIKQLSVWIQDTPVHRDLGAQTEVTIEAL